MGAALAGTAIFLIAALPLLTADGRVALCHPAPLILGVGFLLRDLAGRAGAFRSVLPLGRPCPDAAAPAGGPSVCPYRQRRHLPPCPLHFFAQTRTPTLASPSIATSRVAPLRGSGNVSRRCELPAAVPAVCTTSLNHPRGLAHLALSLLAHSGRPQHPLPWRIPPAARRNLPVTRPHPDLLADGPRRQSTGENFLANHLSGIPRPFLRLFRYTNVALHYTRFSRLAWHS